VALPDRAVFSHILQAVLPVPHSNMLALVPLGPLQEVGEIVFLKQKRHTQGRPSYPCLLAVNGYRRTFSPKAAAVFRLVRHELRFTAIFPSSLVCFISSLLERRKWQRASFQARSQGSVRKATVFVHAACAEHLSCRRSRTGEVLFRRVLTKIRRDFLVNLM
jgi:hypothetical protein